MSKKHLEDYRKGAIGALMDEYARAAFELKSLVENVGETDYTRIADAETKDADCHSIQTIMNHVVHAGYSYTNSIRRKLSMPFEPLGDARRFHKKKSARKLIKFLLIQSKRSKEIGK